ncbi:MAG: hypothetical protein HYX32_05980 [Actinobacteria bacterium]|nr:hypothetical protein [Actinomycetota bacterium]
MGTWVYEVPYQSSANRALEELQAKVLAEGTYAQPWREDPQRQFDVLLGAYEGMGLWDELQAEMAQAGKRDTFDRLRSGAEPRDRMEAVLWSGAAGTGSILDIEKAEPIERTELAELFGSVHPDINVIRENQAHLHERAELDGLYLVAYEEGLPIALVFFGSTGA